MIPFVIFCKAWRKRGSIHELNKLQDSHPWAQQVMSYNCSVSVQSGSDTSSRRPLLLRMIIVENQCYQLNGDMSKCYELRFDQVVLYVQQCINGVWWSWPIICDQEFTFWIPMTGQGFKCCLLIPWKESESMLAQQWFEVGRSIEQPSLQPKVFYCLLWPVSQIWLSSFVDDTSPNSMLCYVRLLPSSKLQFEGKWTCGQWTCSSFKKYSI
jgi:hypothetical protein